MPSSQINSAEFLNGVRTVLKRDNVVEAIAICDATPGPVARIVKTAILNRDRGRERVREAVEEAGLTEVPRLEEKLNLLATIAQIAPLLGLLGTIIGFIHIFMQLQADGLYAHISGEHSLSSGIWESLICAAAGIAVAIPVHAGYNYLVSRINRRLIIKAPPEYPHYRGNPRTADTSLGCGTGKRAWIKNDQVPWRVKTKPVGRPNAYAPELSPFGVKTTSNPVFF